MDIPFAEPGLYGSPARSDIAVWQIIEPDAGHLVIAAGAFATGQVAAHDLETKALDDFFAAAGAVGMVALLARIVAGIDEFDAGLHRHFSGIFEHGVGGRRQIFQHKFRYKPRKMPWNIGAEVIGEPVDAGFEIGRAHV